MSHQEWVEPGMIEEAKRSRYMEWAKTSSTARYNLASSGLTSVPIAEFPFRLEELEITGGDYGYAPLLERIAQHTGAPVECIVTAEGTSMANHLAMAALLEPADEVVIELPTYGLLLDLARYLGARVKRITRRFENNFEISLPEMEQAITPATRLVVLTNLQNPTGALISAETLRVIGELARGVGASVLVDEVYLEMLFERAQDGAFSLGENFIVTSSLTKAYGLSGLRCGWILAAPELAHRIWRLNDLFAATAAHPAECMSVMAFGPTPCLRLIVRFSIPFSIRDRIWHAFAHPPAQLFSRVWNRATRTLSFICCARSTKPRSCPASSSGCPGIFGSGSAEKRKTFAQVWSDWARRSMSSVQPNEQSGPRCEVLILAVMQ
jgi:hypothetical protein